MRLPSTLIQKEQIVETKGMVTPLESATALDNAKLQTAPEGSNLWKAKTRREVRKENGKKPRSSGDGGPNK